jgi:transposase
MSKVALKIENYTSDELLGLIRKDEKFSQALRLFACYQVSLGKRPQDLEDLYDTTFKSICNWIHRLNEGGVEALLDKPKTGRPGRLDPVKLDRIKELVLNETPEDYGFESATWTGPLLISWISKEFGVTYKKAQIYNILDGLRLSFQKGKGIYPESEGREEQMEAVKKTPRGT